MKTPKLLLIAVALVGLQANASLPEVANCSRVADGSVTQASQAQAVRRADDVFSARGTTRQTPTNSNGVRESRSRG